MGNKDTTQTSSQTYGPPDWVKQGYQQLFGQAQNTAQTPYNKKTNQNVANLDPGQTNAINAIQGSTGVAQPYLDQASQYAQQGAAPITGADIQSYQNPWTDQVVNATQADFAHQNAQQAEATNSNAAKIGALTGDRSQVAQQIQQESQNRTQNPVIANLRSQGFNTAAGLAETDKGRQGQAAYTMGNLGNEAQQTALTGQQAALGASGLNQQQQQTQLNASSGNAKQQSAYPFQTQQWLAGLESGIGSLSGGQSSGTQTTPGPNIGSQIVGAGLTLASFSDERLKSDIEEIGQTHDGQPIYRYRMGDSPRTEIGLLAQNVEQTHPDAVGQSQGFKTVNYKTATDGAVHRAEGGGVMPYGDSYVPNVQISHGSGPQPAQMSGGQGGGGQSHSGGIGDMMKDFAHAHDGMSKLGEKMRTTNSDGGWSTTVNPSGPEGWGNYLGNTLGGWGDKISSGIGAMGNSGMPTGGFAGMMPEGASGGFASMLPDMGGGGGFGLGSMLGGFADGGEVDDDTDTDTATGGDGGISDLLPDDTGAYAGPDSKSFIDQGAAYNPVDAPAPVHQKEESHREGPLFGMIDEKYRPAMLAAGLGMLASRSPNFGNAVGEGGLAGVNAYHASQKTALAAKHIDNETARLHQAADQAQALMKLRTQIYQTNNRNVESQITHRDAMAPLQIAKAKAEAQKETRLQALYDRLLPNRGAPASSGSPPQDQTPGAPSDGPSSPPGVPGVSVDGGPPPQSGFSPNAGAIPQHGDKTAVTGAPMPSMQTTPDYYSDEDQQNLALALISPRAATAMASSPGRLLRAEQAKTVGKELGSVEERQRAGTQVLKGFGDLRDAIAGADDATVSAALGPYNMSQVPPSERSWSLSALRDPNTMTRPQADAAYRPTPQREKIWNFQNLVTHLVDGLTEEFVASAGRSGVQMSDARQKVFEETMGRMRQATSKSEALKIAGHAEDIIRDSFALPRAAPTPKADLSKMSIDELKALRAKAAGGQ